MAWRPPVFTIAIFLRSWLERAMAPSMVPLSGRGAPRVRAT